MYHIKHVIIEGFWGKYKVETDFRSDVNIFIGKNGTGKTTFILFLQAVLQVDIPVLSNLEFKKIKLQLRDNNKEKTITVEKRTKANLGFDIAYYRISKKPFKVALYNSELDERRYLGSRSRRLDFDILKKELNSLINLSTLSVYRLPNIELSEEEDYFLHKKRRGHILPVENRLESLMKSLTIYQLSLAEEAQRVSKNFQKEVLSSILYDKKFDSAKILIENFAFKKEKEALVKAYKDLGIYDDKLSEKIDNHIIKLEQSIESYKQFKEKKSVFTIDALLPLPLFKRTQHILDLSLKADEERKRIFEPIEKFLDLLREFIKDKEININQSGFLIFKKDKREIPITDLSSGEKQLLILLVETLVQKNKYFIFIADEPELSLHIEWQSKILNSIKKLNTNTQIIVATHSPEIAAGRKKSLVNMEKIVYA